MSMFNKYDHLNPEYTPDNSSSRDKVIYDSIDDKIPRLTYNAKGEFIGLTWCQGDKFNLVLSSNKTIKVADNAIIYTEHDKSPNTSIKGNVGQQAYNLYDCKSWTCIGADNGLYIWVEDEEIIYPVNGTKEITFQPDTSENLVIVDIYNFRWEIIYSKSDFGVAEVVIPVDEDFNSLLKPGTYYAVVRVISNNQEILKSKTQLIVT